MLKNGREPAGTPANVTITRFSEHSTEYDKLEAVCGKYQSLNWLENEAVNVLHCNGGPPFLKVIPSVPDWVSNGHEVPKE